MKLLAVLSKHGVSERNVFNAVYALLCSITNIISGVVDRFRLTLL